MQEPDACLEDEEGKELLEESGKMQCGRFFLVVNGDYYSIVGTKIAAQQIHVLKM